MLQRTVKGGLVRFQTLAAVVLTAGLTSHPAAAQDLDRLHERAARLWELRVAGNLPEAASFVEPDGRETFLAARPPRVLTAEVSGLRFQDVPSEVVVIVDMRIFSPEIGQTNWRVEDSWIWTGEDWFLRMPVATNPFLNPFETTLSGEEREPLPPPAVEITFPRTVIDLGVVTQGEVIRGSLEFMANEEDVLDVRTGGPDRLTFKRPRWVEPGRGFLDFEWDTSLLWEDVSEPVNIQVLGRGRAVTTTSVTVNADVVGRLRFEQFPEVFDAADAETSRVELELTNLTDKTLRLATVEVSNPAFVLDLLDDDQLEPEQSVRLGLTFTEGKATAGSIRLRVEPSLEENPIFIVPLRLERPERLTRSGPPSREFLEQFIQEAQRP